MEISSGITYSIALLAGIVSFVSPCILPLVPSYLAFIAGDSQEKRVMIRVRRSLFFVAGFGIVFVLLGASFGLFGSVISSYNSVLGRVAGGIVFILGLHFMGVIRIPLLMREYRFHPGTGTASSIKAFLLGGAFGLGWTPCVGPILASILFLASQSATLIRGTMLLTIYSIGLGIPLVAMAFGYEKMIRQTEWLRHHMRLISILSGGLLIVIGIFIFLGTFQNLTVWILSFSSRLTDLPEARRMVFDTSVSFASIAAGLCIVAWAWVWRIKRQGVLSWGGLVVGLLLVSAGVIGTLDIVTPTRFLTAWLSWQGL